MIVSAVVIVHGGPLMAVRRVVAADAVERDPLNARAHIDNACALRRKRPADRILETHAGREEEPGRHDAANLARARRIIVRTAPFGQHRMRVDPLPADGRGQKRDRRQPAVNRHPPIAGGFFLFPAAGQNQRGEQRDRQMNFS